MKLGIGSYTFTWAVGVPGHPPAQPLTASGLLQQARALGVGLVQFGDNLPLTPLSPGELDELEEHARSSGIAIEVGTRGLDKDNLLAYLSLARRFQAPFVRLVIDAPGQEPSPDQAIALLRPMIAEFAGAGVRLAIENHDRFSVRALARMVESLGPEHVGICLDTVNSLGALEGPESVVNLLAPYTLNLHLKDFVIRRVPSQMGFVVTGCALGQGRLDVPWLLEALRRAGRDVNAIIELWTPPAATLEATLACEQAWAEQSARYLRQFISE